MGSSSDWFVQRVGRDVNLLDAPHCIELLVICILLMKSVCSYLRLTVIKCCLLISCDFLSLFSVNGLFRVNSDRKKSNCWHAALPIDFTMKKNCKILYSWLKSSKEQVKLIDFLIPQRSWPWTELIVIWLLHYQQSLTVVL